MSDRGVSFVGRETELGLLRGDLAAAMAGAGRLVTLVGEPGVGKTRTAMALAAEARARGVAIAWGRCHESGGAPVYWPWRQALGALAADGESEDRTALAALLPDLHGGAGVVGVAGFADAPDRARFELFDRVADGLRRAARARPLLLVLDDLHWADAGSLHLLEFVAREADTLRLLVLGTYRESDLAQRVEIAAIRSAVRRLARSVSLAGLPIDPLRALIAEQLGHTPDEPFVAEIAALTDANPFFVIEVLRLLATMRDRAARPPIPPGVQEVLRRRIDGLPAATRRLLDAAAVVGRDFDLAPLATVLDITLDSVLDALTPALEADIVRAAGGRLRHYVFAHALMRESLYDGLAPSARAALHAAVGTALETVAPPDPDHLAALAHHFYEAAQTSDAAKAITYGCAAGEHALAVLAFEEALRHFERALGAAAVARDDALRLRILLGLGEAAYGAGSPDRGQAAFRDAMALGRRQGPAAFAEAVLRYSGAHAEFGVIDVEMNELLEEALAAVGPERSARRARLMARLAAGLAIQAGAETRRRQLADEATALARSLDDPATLEWVLTRRLIALLGPDAIDERLAITDEILHTPTSSRASDAGALIFRADDLAQRGDRTGLDHVLAAFEQKARASRQPFFLWMLASFRTATALFEGRFAEAEALAGETLALGQPVQASTAVLYWAQQMFTLRGWQTRFDEVRPLIEAGANQLGVIPAWRCTLANFYEVSGQRVEGRREYDAVAAAGFASLPRDAGWHGAVYQLASVCSRFDDRDGASVLYDLLRPFAGRVAVAWPLVLVVGPIDQRLGMLADTLGRHEVAERHFADAMAVAERMRALPWQAETRLYHARALLRRGGRMELERAREMLDDAEAMAESLGMTLLLQWVTAARASTPAVARAAAGGTSRRMEPPGRRAVLSLVPREATTSAASAPRAGTFRTEGDVWALGIDGRTTRLRHMVGFAQLARLLREPTKEIPATDLAGVPAGAPDGDAGELLDAEARADYTARLREAREELAEAERLSDRGRVERLTDEVELLAAELARGFGLGGRARRAGQLAERARIAVTRSIKYAIDRIAEHDASLAEHLRAAVRTGRFCSYSPSARDRVVWDE